MSAKKNSTNMVALVTMCFIFAMISFVTNMAAPFGVIWGNQYEWSRMAGNLMNFAAYLFMGIPAGKMLLSVGYKKTTLIALATGFVGICIQYLSSFSFLGGSAIYVYLLGAFVCGFCVCMLNTVDWRHPELPHGHPHSAAGGRTGGHGERQHFHV